MSPTAPQGSKPHRLIKLGVDVHLREYVVVRQIAKPSHGVSNVY